MIYSKSLTFFTLAILFSCFSIGCKEAKQVADVVQTMSTTRAKGPMHDRLKWKAEDFFTDKDVINLCKAIEAKDLKEIERLVKSGVDINFKGRANMTPLMWSFPMGEQVFKKVLDLGADPNIKLTKNYLALNGKSVTFAAVKLVDGPIYNQYFYDVLMDNYLEIVLKHGGDPNQQDLSGRTPLFYATLSDTQKVSKKIHLLLDAGGKIDLQDQQGATAVLNTYEYRFDSRLALLKNGADYRIPNKYGYDLILRLEQEKTERMNNGNSEFPTSDAKALFDWLTNEGVNWDAASAALKDQNLMKNLKDLPADYKHRPWLPQRETLKKPDK